MQRNNTDLLSEGVFFALLRSGLWMKKEQFDYSEVHWKTVYQLAVEQTVAGYVAVGIDNCIPDSSDQGDKPLMPEQVRSTFTGIKLTTGVRNHQMNDFIAGLFTELNSIGIYPILLKGQGVAQNYINPEIRQAGDIDLLLRGDDYEKAKAYLLPKADKAEVEGVENKHLGLHFGKFEVELHGMVSSHFGKRYDSILLRKLDEMIEKKNFRYWTVNGVKVPLPSANFDAIFIFTHFLRHFYLGGLGLRQICDWMMHIHKNVAEIDIRRLRSDIIELGVEREWQTFGSLVVYYLGMPQEEFPMYSRKYVRFSHKLWQFMRASGNFGHHRGRKDYSDDPYLIRKMKSMFIKGGDIMYFISVFPLNSIKVLSVFLANGFSVAVRGK